MQQIRGSGQERVRSGECCCSNLPGRRCTSVDQRDAQRFGHLTSAEFLRRLEVVAEGLTLFGECQLALDATIVSPLHGDGTHRRGADITDGAALGEARKDKVRTYPDLCRGNGMTLLVVIAGKVDGRWSDETKSFLWCLGSAKAAAVTERLFGSARAAWYRRWTCMLACSAATGFASSLVGVRGSPRAGDQVPSVHEVLADARHFL